MKKLPTKRSPGCRSAAAVAFCGIGWLLLGGPANADDDVPATDARQRLAALEQQIAEIEYRSQQEILALQQRTDAQLESLRKQVAQLQEPKVTDRGSPRAVPAGHEPVAAESAPVSLHGDFRIRYETNSALDDQASWDRGVLRGRLEALYRVDEGLELGARVVTGDRSNPRTSDLTLGDFDGDLELSLDRAYASYRQGDLFVIGGKFANPFTRTELVFDGDVNPQGAAAQYSYRPGSATSLRLTGIYFPIDIDPLAGDSEMRGLQLSGSWHAGSNMTMDLHAAYYDYDIGQLSPGVQEHARGNNVAPGGTTLLSDFDLLDVVGVLEWSGSSDRWPLRFVGDYVRNRGAAVPEDAGYSLDVYAGRLDRPGDFLLQYGYSQVETDGVLGWFSSDNIPYATNYRLHTLSLAYKLMDRTYLGLTGYRFRRLNPELTAATGTDWASRTRLNLYFAF